MAILIEAVVVSGMPDEGFAVLTVDWSVIAVFFEREDALKYINYINNSESRGLWLRPARLNGD